MAEVLTRWLHFLGIVSIFSALTLQHLLLKREVERVWLNRAAVVDAIYGAAAIITVIAGLTLWFGVGKAASYYSANWIFHAKVGLVGLVVVLSIPPTLFLLRQRKLNQPVVNVPRHITHLIRTQLLLLPIILLLAILMARGYGVISP